MNKTRKVLVTVGHGLVSRNLLRNRFLAELLKRPELKIIMLTPAAEDPKFVSEFKHENITFVPMPRNETRPRRESLINALHAATVFNGTSHVKFLYRLQTNKLIWIKYVLRKLSSFLIGQSRTVRKVITLLDKKLLPDEVYGPILDEFKPDIVFGSSVVTLDECYLLKAAQLRSIPTIGMVKSWDNFVKDIPLRVVPDRMVVWNEIMKSQAEYYQLIQSERIGVTGIPQFDSYEDALSKPPEREKFMRKIGADPEKKLLVFASEGKWSPGDPEIAATIQSLIESGDLVEDCHLHIRPHFCWAKFIEPLLRLGNSGVVSVDGDWNKSDSFPDGWDPSWEDMQHLQDSMRYADIVITSPSTIALDAAYFDTPVINIGFDGDGDRAAAEGRTVRWLYDTEYYKTVMKFEATTLANNASELKSAINQYLENPKIKSDARADLRQAFCYKTDGNAGSRVAGELLKFLDQAV